MVVTTRSSSCKKELCDATAKAMKLAKQKRYAQAIREFIHDCHSNPRRQDLEQEMDQTIRLEYLMLHTASIISLQEFERCLCLLYSKLQ